MTLLHCKLCLLSAYLLRATDASRDKKGCRSAHTAIDTECSNARSNDLKTDIFHWNSSHYDHEDEVQRRSLQGHLLRDRYRLDKFLYSVRPFWKPSNTRRTGYQNRPYSYGLTYADWSDGKSHWPLENDRFAGPVHLSAGSFGDVWEATDNFLGRKVAVKLFYKNSCDHRNVCARSFLTRKNSDEKSKESLKRASKECAVAQNIMKQERSFPAGASRICQCLGNHVETTSRDDALFLVMELCGRDLEYLLDQNYQKQLQLSHEDAREYVAQVSQGLVLLQSLTPPLIHRDLKLENVVLDSGSVKIIDFGLVAEATKDRQHKGWAGTRGYWPPEIEEGKRRRKFLAFEYPTHSFDVYSLGVVYLMLLCPSIDSPGEPGSWNERSKGHTEDSIYEILHMYHCGLNHKNTPLLSQQVSLIADMLAKDPARRPHPLKLWRELGNLKLGNLGSWGSCSQKHLHSSEACKSEFMFQVGTAVEVRESVVQGGSHDVWLKAFVGGCAGTQYCLLQLDQKSFFVESVHENDVREVGQEVAQ